MTAIWRFLRVEGFRVLVFRVLVFRVFLRELMPGGMLCKSDKPSIIIIIIRIRMPCLHWRSHLELPRRFITPHWATHT